MSNIVHSSFEKLIDKLVERTKAPCLKALQDAKLNANDIDAAVNIVKGSARSMGLEVK